MAKSKDLFDDSTMSFGDHLEALRIHLWKAIIGVVICVIFALFIGNNVIDVVRGPIDVALEKYGQSTTDDVGGFDFWKNIKAFWDEESQRELDEEQARKNKAAQEEIDARESAEFEIIFQESALAAALHGISPEKYPEPKSTENETVSLIVQSPQLGKMADMLFQVDEKQRRPVTLTVQEAFMTYLKVAFVSGFVMASPWVFYQLWLFVAAGLYPHERRYIHVYLPFSIVLFFTGALFCFYLVFPFVLDFLLGFNQRLGIQPQIRLSEWVSFALMLPLMFGISFQLPLVMLFLERISIFSATDYRERRRVAVLVIAILSMLMTPADPASMLMMMFPLIALYELGIILCNFRAAPSPFADEATD